MPHDVGHALGLGRTDPGPTTDDVMGYGFNESEGGNARYEVMHAAS